MPDPQIQAAILGMGQGKEAAGGYAGQNPSGQQPGGAPPAVYDDIAPAFQQASDILQSLENQLATRDPKLAHRVAEILVEIEGMAIQRQDDKKKQVAQQITQGGPGGQPGQPGGGMQ